MNLDANGLPLRSTYATRGAAGTYTPPQRNCTNQSPGYWGFSDQKTGVWRDNRLGALGVRRARLVVGWDAVLRGEASSDANSPDVGQLRDIDAWMTETLDRCYDILVSFEKSHLPGREGTLPDPYGDYAQAFDAFRRRYPFVKVYSPWNEPNKPQQPPANSPEQAGKFWRVLRSRCAADGGSCTALAGEFLDDNFGTRGGLQLGKYIERYKLGMGRRAYSWAFHPYVSANYMPGQAGDADSKWTAFLRATRCSACSRYKNPIVWITEVGGLVSFVAQSGAQPRNTRGVAAAERAIGHIADLAEQEPRVRRLFYYNWLGDENFDSGLVSYKQSPPGDVGAQGLELRRMYCALRTRTRLGVACP